VFYVRWNGAGGVRDPLMRDAAAVARDVAEGVVSAQAARELYGVVLGPDVDRAATDKLRGDMRADRRHTNVLGSSGGRPCINPSCAANGHAVGIRERLMSKIGPAYTTGPQTTLSEMVCTECGALLDAQVTMHGAGPLFDGYETQEHSDE
jgi:hypothetical protein